MLKLRLALLVGLLAFAAAVEEEKVTPKDISDCKRALEAVKIDYTGSTVLCPTNKGLAELAKAAGFGSVDALLADAAKNTKTRETVERILKAHVLKGVVPKAAVKAGDYPSLLSAAEPKVTTTVVIEEDGDIEVEAGEEDMDIIATDLTFEGTYRAGTDKYVVHALEGAVLPSGTPFQLEEEKDKEESDKEDESPAPAPAAPAPAPASSGGHPFLSFFGKGSKGTSSGKSVSTSSDSGKPWSMFGLQPSSQSAKGTTWTIGRRLLRA